MQMKRGALSLFNVIKSIFNQTSKDVEEITSSIVETHSNESAKKANKSIFKNFKKLIKTYSSKKYNEVVYNRLAQPLQMIEADSTKEFVKYVNKYVGVSLKKIKKQENLKDFMNAKTLENASLITGMTQEFIKKAQAIVTNGVNTGLLPTSIEEQLKSNLPLVNAKRAKLIARDQYAKINGQVNKKRSEQLGITLFKYVAANDDRVSGKPSGKYPNAKIKCYVIANTDIGYGKGIYTWKEGASYGGKKNILPGLGHINCRCISLVVIPGANYDLDKKVMI